MTIQTNTKYNFDKAQDDNFSWNFYDGTNGSILTHKASGREIYQMHWCTGGKMAEKVEGEMCDAVRDFWAELHELQNAKPVCLPENEPDPEPEHGQNGYCRTCHSYCYGDCAAN